MFFCENCGAQLREGMLFCEECGEAVAAYAIQDTVAFPGLQDNPFCREDWMTQWSDLIRSERKNGRSVGLLLTNTGDCPDSSELEKAVADFVICKRGQGVCYVCLDLATEVVAGTRGDGCVEGVLRLLQRIYRVAVPDYLLIVGDNHAVGAKQWENPTDKDVCVRSDLPYWTMDTVSPWEGRKYDFGAAVPTGRIPSAAGSGFLEACAYLKNYIAWGQPHEPVQAFGMSAYQWREVSEDIYRALGSGLLLSPEALVEYIGTVEGNLLYFNLHGSNTDNYWYGQRGNSYPKAFAACALPQKLGYVIGVEACYGAAQHSADRQPPSILLEAMKNGCLAFVGSDTVAYGGIRRGQNCCADVIISRFLREVKAGSQFGPAFLAAMQELWSCREKDDTLVKTLAQFALYGDPSVRLTEKAAPTYRHSGKLAVPMPDISGAMQISLTKVNMQIEKSLQQYVGKYHETFRDVTPQYYSVRSGMGQAVYTKQLGADWQILKLYHDAFGRVTREYVSR